MTHAGLSKDDLESIKRHVAEHRITLAVMRTEKAPSELDSVLRSAGKVCGLEMVRTQSTPLSDVGFAELNSPDRMLIVLWMGGPRTELVSVSETYKELVAHLEDTVAHSNFFDDVLRHGT